MPTNREILDGTSERLRSRLAESFRDAQLTARVSFEVQSTSIVGLVEVQDESVIKEVEAALSSSVRCISRRWRAGVPGDSPRLEVRAMIPPDVKQQDWGLLSNPSQTFTLLVQGGLPLAQADEPRLLPFPDIPAPYALIMKGGGIKGLAYVGALQVLQEHYQFDRYVGTSAGAIAAILLAAGYNPIELETILKQKNFKDFFDSWLIMKPINMLLHGGFNHAYTFTDWIDTLLAAKLRSTTRVRLSELPNRATVFASRKESGALEFDSISNDHDAAHAARCSMSIPFVFVPQSDQGFNTYDGGLRQNYPLQNLLEEDPHVKFLGLYLGAETYEPKRNMFQLFDILSIWTESQEPELLKKYRQSTIVIDPAPVGTLDFDLSDKEKAYLLATGKAAAYGHLEYGSAKHQAVLAERESLKKEVLAIRSRRWRWKWFKRLLIPSAVALYLLASYGYNAFMHLWRG